MKEMSAALNERNKENRQDNLHSLETNLNNNDGETQTYEHLMRPVKEMQHVPRYNQLDCVYRENFVLALSNLCVYQRNFAFIHKTLAFSQ